jgi:predicted Ser/Thr protein kinase
VNLDACPSDDELLAYVSRSLSGERRVPVERHLAVCESCPAIVAAAAEELHESGAGVAASPEDPPREAEPSHRHVLEAGARLGRYVILELLGRGAMGVVYAAYDPQLDRRVALKLLRADRRVAALEERFLREGQTMARLSHENLVSVHDVGMIDGGIFLAMEYVEGQTLRAWLAAEERPWTEILAAYLAAGRGLAAAHRSGVVHRDFKPDNVLVARDGRVRVTDFGLARLAGSAEAEDAPPEATRPLTMTATGALPGTPAFRAPEQLVMTATGALLGTPAFMAPEQLLGETATAAADQFAFASALYQALFQQHPFPGDDFEALRAAVLAGALREPPRGSVPAHVRRALRRALSRAPEDRFASMTELEAALADDPRRRRRTRLATLGLPALVLAAGILAFRLLRPAPEPPCRAGAPRLAAVWNEGTRGAIGRAFEATGVPYAAAARDQAVRALEGYAAAWGAGYTEACEATEVRREQSPLLLDRRMSCLDDRLRDLGATAGALGRADRTAVEKAAELTAALRPLAACADRARLLAAVAPPDDPAVRARVTAVRDQLAALRVEGAVAGKGKAPLDRAEQVVRDALAVPYPALAPEAQLVLGRLQRTSGRFDPSAQTLEAAFLGAERTGNDELAVAVLTELVRALATAQKVDDALRWGTVADAKLGRVGDPPTPRGRLLAVRAMALEGKFSTAEALPLAEEAVSLLARERGPEDLDVLDATVQLGTTLSRASRYADAAAVLARAVRGYEAQLGPEHPRVANAYHELSFAQKALGKRREAMASALRAGAINERAYGPDHYTVGANLFPVGQIQLELGLRPEALITLHRSLAIIEQAGGPDSGQLIPPLVMVCVARAALPGGEEAVPTCERVRALAARLTGEDSVVTAIVDNQYAVALELLGRLPEACRRNDRASAVMAEKAHDHSDRAGLLAFESRCLREQGPPAAARAVAVAAEAVALGEKVFGPTSSDVATTRLELSASQLAAGDAAGARAQAELALRDLTDAELDPATVLEARFTLGEALRRLGAERERADQLLHAAGPPLLESPYATPALRRRIRAALARQGGGSARWSGYRQ